LSEGTSGLNNELQTAADDEDSADDNDVTGDRILSTLTVDESSKVKGQKRKSKKEILVEKNVDIDRVLSESEMAEKASAVDLTKVW